MERVVVVGAGFGGLTAARRLAGKPVAVTLVDRQNYHLFQPLLYQVATAGLEPQAIAHAVRGIFKRASNVDFRLATVTGVDWEGSRLLVDIGEPVPFDWLVLAAGATTKTLGIDGVAEHTFPLKTLDDAVRLRDHILTQFEKVDSGAADDPEAALTFVVVGGGPTGVEVCGALVELVDEVLTDDFRWLGRGRARIVLVEALDAVLTGFTPQLRGYARRALEGRGVEVLLECPLKRVEPGGVLLGDGRFVGAATVLWAAGVRAHTLADGLGIEQTSGGRIVVDDDLSIPGRGNVFAIGDIAAAKDPAGGLYPQLAPVAMQQGEHAVHQIARRRRDLPTEPFRYVDKGIMATIGRHAAVAELPVVRRDGAPRLRLSGRAAWLTWLLAHLLFLVGFRNRAVVLLNWIYNYVTYDRAARLIIRGDTTPRRTPGEEADVAAGRT